MKIAGIDPSLIPNEEVLVLPRGEDRIVFRARGLNDSDEFNVLCPPPKAPVKQTKDGVVPHYDDPGYKSVLQEHNERWIAYLIVKSLEPSQIEWDTVKLDDPSTWKNWETDLTGAGFSAHEKNLIGQLALDANRLDERKLEKARQAFLRGQAKAAE